MTGIHSRRDFLVMAGVGVGALALPAAHASTAHASTGTPMAAGFPYSVGRWLPSDQRIVDDWLAQLIRRVDSRSVRRELHPSVRALKELIEGTPEVYMWFHQMFAQVPRTGQFSETPMGTPQVRDYKHMLDLINEVLTTAPEFNKTGLVGFPINAILNWSMATWGGFAAFLDPRVNLAFKGILNAWGQFLTSPASASVLGKDPRTGWFGRDAREAMPNFDEEFICDPEARHHGFVSWDDFFTRRFRVGQRPVAAPDDDSVVVNACESAPYRIARGLRRVDRFWIKGQPYSLRHMFADDPVNEQFVGGTLYQAFLSALSYHRWHSPVSGRIVSVRNIDGTYYAANQRMGFDPASPNESQGYINELAARAVVLIEADNPDIGLMAFIAVGMAEVSSCDVTVTPGQRVAKGEQLGMFHFGGSTHCLIFRPGVKVRFDLHGQTPGLDSSNIPLHSSIARIG